MTDTTTKIEIEKDAAPDVATIESAVAGTVSKQVADTGLEAQETPKENDIELQQTTLDMAEPIVEEMSALTSYVDVSATRVTESTATAMDVVDKNFMFPPDYFKVVERSMPVGNVPLSTQAPNQWPIARLDIANVLLGYRAIADKLNYVSFIRYNLEVEIKVLATNYHYGQLMFVWRPSYAPFLIGEHGWASQGVQRIYETTFHSASATTISASFCNGPYDNVYTASQLDHHILPITAGGNITIKLPWTLNRQYVQTEYMMMPENHIGYLDVYQLTPLAPTNIDVPLVQVFGRFVDIVGFGYRALSDPCAQDENRIVRRRYAWGTDVNWNHWLNAMMVGKHLWAKPHGTNLNNFGFNMFDPFGQESGSVYKSSPWYEPHKKDPPTTVSETEKVANDKEEDGVGDNVPIEVAESGEIDRQQRGGALYSTFNRVVSTANTIAGWVGDALAFFGLSKPPMKGIPSRFTHMAPPMTNSVGPDFSVSNGVNPDSLVLNKRSDHSEMVLVDNLGKCETYLGWAEFNTTSVKEYEGWIAPQFCINYYNNALKMRYWYRTPASMLCERFTLWRSGAKYRLHFASSSFVSARFAITVEYDFNRDDAERVGIVPTQIVEVKGDMTVEGEIPYLKPSLWMTNGERVCYLRIKMLDNAVTWNAARGTPIYMSMWISYPGLQVAFPCQNIEGGIPWSAFKPGDMQPRYYKPVLRAIEPHASTVPEVAESGKLPGLSKESGPVQCGMNDIVTSLYHLAKRFNPGYGRLLMPFAPSAMWLGANNADNASLVTYAPINSHMAACFRWVRGSYIIANGGSHTMVDKLTDNDIASTAEYTDPVCLMNKGIAAPDVNYYRIAMSNNHSSRLSQGLIAQRSPYHCEFPFVPGPFIYLKTSKTYEDGQHSWYPMYGRTGERMQYTDSDGLAQSNKRMPYYEFAYGDDLCYNQWMGCPFAVHVRNSGEGFFPKVVTNTAGVAESNSVADSVISIS